MEFMVELTLGGIVIGGYSYTRGNAFKRNKKNMPESKFADHRHIPSLAPPQQTFEDARLMTPVRMRAGRDQTGVAFASGPVKYQRTACDGAPAASRNLLLPAAAPPKLHPAYAP
jgi:hypothetical protein